jgi:hypothetical protein
MIFPGPGARKAAVSLAGKAASNLALTQVAAAQNQKEVTINAQAGQLDAALTEILSVLVDDTPVLYGASCATAWPAPKDFSASAWRRCAPREFSDPRPRFATICATRPTRAH